MKYTYLLVALILASCSSAGDDQSAVTYSISGSGQADVLIYDTRDSEQTIANAQDGWLYEISTDEGSQLLYIRLANVQGNMKAMIHVDGELVAETSASDGQTRGVSAWGNDSGITLYYTMQSEVRGHTTVSTPQGQDTLAVAAYALQEGPYSLERREYITDAGFLAHISTIADADQFGCVFLRIEAEPIPGERIDLASEQRCSTGQFDTSVSVPVYGYGRK